MSDAWDMPEDERTLVDTVRRFAIAELEPAAAAIDEDARFIHDHLPKLAGLGLMGLNLPEAYGGAGVSAHALFACVGEVAAACGATGSVLTAHYLATDAILHGGDEAQRRKYLPALASGQLGAFALTEPGAGSNPADMSTRAERTDVGYRLRGAKQFISNAAHADVVVVFAKTDPAAGARGISAFAVDRGTPGLVFGAAERTMGLKGGHVFAISLDCDVPMENRLGPEGTGFKTALRTLDNGRLEVAAMCCGIADRALQRAIAFAKERHIGGEPLAANQGIQWMLADMATDLSAARQLSRGGLDRRQRGVRFSMEAAMAKLYASEMAGRVTDKAMQIHGGYGYTRDLPLERYVRDVRIMRIYEGSSEVQRNIIARGLLAG